LFSNPTRETSKTRFSTLFYEKKQKKILVICD